MHHKIQYDNAIWYETMLYHMIRVCIIDIVKYDIIWYINHSKWYKTVIQIQWDILLSDMIQCFIICYNTILIQLIQFDIVSIYDRVSNIR